MLFCSSCHLTQISRCTIAPPLTTFPESFLEANMKDRDLAMMSAEELWALHEKIRAMLSTKLDAEKHQLERRLAQLNGQSDKQRRPYPKVLPKYQNPERPFETWSGRGNQPRWVAAHLRTGKKVDDLLVARPH
jgi:DNA-binding protein H-NS